MEANVFNDGAREIFDDRPSNDICWEKGYAVVVAKSLVIVRASRESVGTDHGITRFVKQGEVELREFKGPTSLATVEFLGSHEILEVFMVGMNFKRGG